MPWTVETDGVLDVELAEHFSSNDDGEFEPEEIERRCTLVARQLRSSDRNTMRRTMLWTEIGARSVLQGVQLEHRICSRKRKGQVDGEQRGARIFSDCHFMSTSERSVPMRALKFSRSRRITAMVLPSRDVAVLGVEFHQIQ